MYRLCPVNAAGQQNQVKRLNDFVYVPFDPANTDYTRFKREINADQAQLEDADGNAMSAADARAFVSTLP